MVGECRRRTGFPPTQWDRQWFNVCKQLRTRASGPVTRWDTRELDDRQTHIYHHVTAL